MITETHTVFAVYFPPGSKSFRLFDSRDDALIFTGGNRKAVITKRVKASSGRRYRRWTPTPVKKKK